MTTVWVLPIEPFEERYTADWYRWWPDELSHYFDGIVVIGGSDEIGERESGQWLDATKTWIWKGQQVANLAKMWSSVKDGDVILSLDAWGPSTTAALYMRQTTGRKVKIVGFWHAGCWDPHDFLHRTGCADWGLHIERGWAAGSDLILCGSHFAADLIRRVEPRAKCEVIGVPVKQSSLRQYRTPWEDRDRLVVFPHRLAPEKGLDTYQEIADLYAKTYPRDRAHFVRSRDLTHSKREYYQLLGRSRVSLSCAHQETFGIAMQETIALGCHAVAPRRLSYPEVFRGQGSLYDSNLEAVRQIRYGLDRPSPATWDGHHENAIKRAANAIKELIT